MKRNEDNYKCYKWNIVYLRTFLFCSLYSSNKDYKMDNGFLLIWKFTAFAFFFNFIFFHLFIHSHQAYVQRNQNVSDWLSQIGFMVFFKMKTTKIQIKCDNWCKTFCFCSEFLFIFFFWMALGPTWKNALYSNMLRLLVPFFFLLLFCQNVNK